MQVADESRRGFDGMSSLQAVMDALSPVALMLEKQAFDQGRAFGYCRGCGIWREGISCSLGAYSK